MKTACPSPRCPATSAAWRRTGPARARDPTTASASGSWTKTVSWTSSSPRLSVCSGSPRDAFDSSPHAPLVRGRLAAAADDGRDEYERVQRMPLAVHRRDDGAPRVVGVGRRARRSDARQPELHAVRRVARHPSARRGRPRRRRDGHRRPNRRESPGAGAVRRGRSRRIAHAAGALGLRHPSRRARTIPQRPGADRLRCAHPRLRPHRRGRRPGAGGAERVQRRHLGALHRRDAVPRPGDATGRVAREARRGRPGGSRIDRGAGAVLREGPAGIRPGGVLRRTKSTGTGCPR